MKQVTVFKNWRKEDPCYMMQVNLAEEYSEVVQKAENVGCALEYAAERFLSKFVGDKPGFFLAAHNKMCGKLDRI